MAQDKGEKTGGIMPNKGEQVGPLVTAIGLDMGYSTNAMAAEQASYRMIDVKTQILRKYGVKMKKSGDAEDVAAVDLTNVNDENLRPRSARIKNELYQAGATADEIQFVVNTVEFEAGKQKLRKTLRADGQSYYNGVRTGADSKATKSDVMDTAMDLDYLMNSYVRDNNHYLESVKP